MQSVLSIVAVLGVGSIVAALISWRISISNHRQTWIDALRDDLSGYLKELENVHYAFGAQMRGGTEAVQKLHEARTAALFVYWRIVLRLNRTEQMHIALRQALDEMMMVRDRVPDRDKIEELVDLARRILKQEWEVTKYGVFANLVVWWKSCRKFS
jgi:hypothetical protein